VLKASNCLLLIGGIGVQSRPSGDSVYCRCVGIYCCRHSEGIVVLFCLFIRAVELTRSLSR